MNYAPLMVGLSTKSFGVFDQINKKILDFINGYILYANNFSSSSQLQKLTSDIQGSRADLGLPPALIAVDYEGGPVQRFCGDDFTKIPGAASIGQLYLDDQDASIALVRDIGLVIAAELGVHGINLCLGPVLDVFNANSSYVPRRSYSENPHDVINISSHLLEVYKTHGINCIGKHFPGFGASVVDTHAQFPIINLAWEELEYQHIETFKTTIQKGLLPGVMLTHGAYTAIDIRSVPVSSKWIQSILREKLGFNGVVITDCLAMISAKTMGESYSSRIINCLKAGCDIALMSFPPKSIIKTFEELYNSSEFMALICEKNEESTSRIHKLLTATRPIDYYKNLIETQSYQNARHNIEKYNATIENSSVQIPQSIQSGFVLQLKKRTIKFLKKIMKPVIKNPRLREVLYGVYRTLNRTQKLNNK